MKSPQSFLQRFFWRLASFFLTAILIGGFIYLYFAIQLPNVEALKDLQLQVPLRIYTQDGKFIGEFGEMRRSPVPLDKIPKQLINAVLATEDQRFFEHPGVDVFGLMRAAIQLALTGTKSQGGSTITMQVARNFYLTSKKTYMRKLNEILLAVKIDQELSKQKILELYLNKIYLGNRAYGVAAAAQVYYGKPLDQLTLPQLAMIAGLPKAPSTINPIVNPIAAKQRRDHVLTRMLELNYIDKKTYNAAMEAPIAASFHGQPVEVQAPYVAEMVRDTLVNQYGDDVYRNGYRVYTTIDSSLQTSANQALRSALIAYDERHGYRQITQNLGSPDHNSFETWRNALQVIPTLNGLKPAAVVDLSSDSIVALLSNGQVIHIPWNRFAWQSVQTKHDNFIAKPDHPSEILKTGDIIRVQKDPNGGGWILAQVPEVEGALVSLNPQNGAITSLVGGFDYLKSSFNRVIQAEIQPGSGFKPFIYASALDKGYTLATVINDSPIVFSDANQETLWRPQNDRGKFYGPTRLRMALARSQNMVSIRILQDIGVSYAVNYVSRFGFNPAKLPKELSLALGTASVTPLDMVGGFAVFANGGYRVIPYIIDRIEDSSGKVLYQAEPKVAGVAGGNNLLTANNETVTSKQNQPTAAAVISPETAFLITSALQDVIRQGTGRGALILNRNDLSGKTGSTNDNVDAWFNGFNNQIVATAWVGFDKPYPLGEYGAQAALPMWVQFMGNALKNMPEHAMAIPPDIVSVKIDPSTGMLARADQTNAIDEYFKKGTEPQQEAPVGSGADANSDGNANGDSASQSAEPLF